ncbi:MAG: DNA alkylation repair protein [Planctomycetota bacterium]
MKRDEVMKKLRAAGKESHRKTYLRHGVVGEIFGVPYAELYKIQRAIGTDQALAEELWATGNHDARVLAAFIADPKTLAGKTLDSWAKTATNQLSLDALSGLASRSERAVTHMKKWMGARAEWLSAAGWHLLSSLAMRPDAPLADEDFAAYLDEIERDIGTAKNRVRHEMNGALIAIGSRGGRLKDRALAIAKRIGKVEVDHGDTACKTPDAITYIAKMAARAKKAVSKASKEVVEKATAKSPATTKKPATKKPATKKPATKKTATKKAATKKAAAKKTSGGGARKAARKRS